jgi:acetyl esterase
MPVDPQIANLLELLNAAPEIDLTSPDAVVTMRTMLDGFMTMLGTGPDGIAQEDHAAPGPAGDVPVRLYRPDGVDRPGVLVFFHGGGFALGNVPSYDRECRILASEAGCAVASVEYRLAPEHPFPAAPDDCFSALSWVADQADQLGLDPERLAVAGDSAGGNLAAVTALAARDNGGPQLRLQLLLYPVVDLSSTMDAHAYPSLLENAEGYFLEAVAMEAFQGWYVPDPGVRNDPSASPILASSLAGLPSAVVLTCEYDPLRDEGEAYAKALANAGVDVDLSRYDGAIHGVFQMSGMTDIGRRFMDEVVAAVRSALS